MTKPVRALPVFVMAEPKNPNIPETAPRGSIPTLMGATVVVVTKPRLELGSNVPVGACEVGVSSTTGAGVVVVVVVVGALV